MAFEAGIAGPETRVEDLPRHFGAYAPEDFDRGFAGDVTAGEALRRSLNLPAVELLDQIGPAQFMARLKLGGVRLHLPAGAAPSLPLALGGAGTTLRDLIGLYAGLATDGSAGAPRILPQPPADGGPFLQPRAAEAIAAVLTQTFPDSSLPCPASPGRPAPVGAAETPGRWVSTAPTSLGHGSGGRMERRCRGQPDAASPCRWSLGCSRYCRPRHVTLPHWAQGRSPAQGQRRTRFDCYFLRRMRW
jgi:hypothetical protein